MTQQKLSSKTYFPPVIHFHETSVFLVDYTQKSTISTLAVKLSVSAIIYPWWTATLFLCFNLFYAFKQGLFLWLYTFPCAMHTMTYCLLIQPTWICEFTIIWTSCQGWLLIVMYPSPFDRLRKKNLGFYAVFYSCTVRIRKDDVVFN